MRLSEQEVKAFIEVLEDVAMQRGGTVEDYSGRGMYGKRCVAFLPDDEYLNAFDLGVEVADRARDAGFPIRDIPGASTDSMGRGIVVYFPSAEWPEGLGRPSEEEGEKYY